MCHVNLRGVGCIIFDFHLPMCNLVLVSSKVKGRGEKENNKNGVALALNHVSLLLVCFCEYLGISCRISCTKPLVQMYLNLYFWYPKETF